MTVLNAHIKNSSKIASIYATLPKHNICFSSIFAHRDLMLMVERKNTPTIPPPPVPLSSPLSPYRPRTFNNRKSSGAATAAVLSHTLSHASASHRIVSMLKYAGRRTTHDESLLLELRRLPPTRVYIYTFYLLITPRRDARRERVIAVLFIIRRGVSSVWRCCLEARRPFISPTHHRRTAIRILLGCCC